MAHFPEKESALNTYYNVVVAYILLNFARLLISVPNKADAISKLANWNIKYPLATTAATKTTTTVEEKDVANVEMRDTLRTIYGDLSASVLTPTDRDTFNLPTPGALHPHLPMPTSNPVGTVNGGARLHHVLTLFDSASGKHAHPHGTSACEVWQKIGGATPVLASELTYIGSTSNAVFATDFVGTDAGKPVYYWMRWVNTRNEKGNWSPVFSANVQA